MSIREGILRRNFRQNLILSYVLIVVFSFSVVAFFLDKSLEEHSLGDIKASLTAGADVIASQIKPEYLNKTSRDFTEELVRTLSGKAKCRITIIDPQGSVVADSDKTVNDLKGMENHLSRPEVREALKGKTGVEIRYSSTLKIDMLYVAIPLKDRTSISGALRLALPLTSVNEALLSVRTTVIMGMLFALLMSFVLGALLVSYTVSPINRMIQVTRRYSEGDFSRRIIHNSKDEIGELADTLNRMAQDIKEKMSHISAQNQKLTAVLNSMTEGVIVLDRAGYIISINHTVEKMFDILDKDAKGRLFLEAIRNNDIAEVMNLVIKKGKPVSAEISLVLPVRKIFQINAVPIFDNGMVNGCLGVFHDITQLRKLEVMRKDFVANVSHELKTPLTSIKGFIETLLDGAIEDKEHNRGFLKIIQEHAERLNNLVNDLLSLSRIESKEASADKKSYFLRKQVDDIISGVKSQLEKKRITVRNELAQELMINADSPKIEQVLTNMIDNAIKFNRDSGTITIYSRNIHGSDRIIIEDSGIGIPEKDIPRIFERFYRVDKARSSDLGGTGLGLSIAKHIIELHSGQIGVESVEGSGSKFWFSLPK